MSFLSSLLEFGFAKAALQVSGVTKAIGDMKERSGFNKIAGPVRQASKYLSSTPYDVAERRDEPLKNKTNVSHASSLIKEPRLDDRDFKAEKVTRETPKPGAVAASSAELRKTAPGEMSSLNFPNPTGQCL